MLSSSRMTAILISEVEIIWMLKPHAASKLNNLAATPECERMPMPTTLSLATPAVCVTPRAPISAATALSTGPALTNSSLFVVKEMSVVPSCGAVCTMTSTTTLAAASALKIFAAVPVLSGTPSMVTFAWLRSMLTPRMTTSSIPGVSAFTMVPGFWLKLLRTSKRTSNLLANSTERDCITLDPDDAISSISS